LCAIGISRARYLTLILLLAAPLPVAAERNIVRQKVVR